MINLPRPGHNTRMTESRARALIASLAIDRLGTDPASVDRVAHNAEYARTAIQCLDDPDKHEALAEVEAAVRRWHVRLCAEDTGPVERTDP